MVHKYIIILIFKMLFVSGDDFIPSFEVNISPAKTCQITAEPFVIYGEKFNMNIVFGKPNTVLNASCKFKDDCNKNLHAENVTLKSDTNAIIHFSRVNTLFKDWTCEIRTSMKETILCDMTIDVKFKELLSINGKAVNAILNPNADINYPIVEYTPGEILYITQELYYKNYISISNDGVNPLEITEEGYLRLMLNTKYYKVTWIHGNLTMIQKPNKNINFTIKLVPNLKSESYMKITVDGTPLTPSSKEYMGNITKYNYIYIYSYRQKLNLTCEGRKPYNRKIYCNNNLTPNKGTNITGISNIFDLDPNEGKTYKTYNIYDNHDDIIEQYYILLKPIYLPLVSVFVSGLRLSQIMYRLKKYAIYEFYDGETLSLECYSNNNKVEDFEWQFPDNTPYSQSHRAEFNLTESDDGHTITCIAKVNSVSNDFRIKLIMKSADVNTDVMAQTENDKTMYSKETRKSGDDIQIYIYIVCAVVLILVTFIMLYIFMTYRKRKAKETTNISYDNLTANEPQQPFPPNWDRNNENQVKLNSEYSVPFTRQPEDNTYCEPTCAGDVIEPMYVDLEQQSSRPNITYANTTNKTLENMPQKMPDTYAAVIPKSMRNKENKYAEIRHDSNTYQNMFKGKPYVNCDVTEYAEVAYCDASEVSSIIKKP